MAKITVICRNEDCTMFNQPQEVEKSEMVCPECGDPVIPFDGGKKPNWFKENGKLVGLIAAALIVLVGGGFGIFKACSSGDNTNQTPKEIDTVQVDSAAKDTANVDSASESINNAQREKDSLQRVADSLASQVEKAKQENNTVKQPKQQPTASNKKDLGYAVFVGKFKNGKPNDVNGRLTFKSSHTIDSRDPKGRIAEPGDYVIGEFVDGRLVQGIWYDSKNVVKGSIIIGM